MSFNCGIVGLPNVGKSTLFNALTATQAAQAANFPFCTIEPNTGRVAVPDERLKDIAKFAGSATIIPAQLEFVDIAGLVKGASTGEGLGNKFLSNIRQTDAIIHVVRCFEDGDITHVEGSVDPLRDIETIETELLLADMESIGKQIENMAKKAKGADKTLKAQHDYMLLYKAALDEGKPARSVPVEDEEQENWRKQMGLMTSKPILYVCNVNEADAAQGNDFSKKVFAHAAKEGAEAVVICAAIEAEIAQLGDEAAQKEFLESMGLTEPGLNRIIRAGFKLLGLQTYFTAGPKEARAWTIHIGDKAPAAAGVIHTDFQRGFIKADVISFRRLRRLQGRAGRERRRQASSGR
ncbi:MAG: redox-regulated ATPase YchF [Alphaproteobacteria bacterium]|nr:redox-regulated ATPase YchF [Alphaproteobacteria bacterium]